MPLRARTVHVPFAIAALFALVAGVIATVAAPQSANAVPAGALSWVVSADLRASVAGAGGTVVASGGANDSAGATSFSLKGSTIDHTYAGTASYDGTVTFDAPSAPGGAVAIVLSAPAVRITSGTTAALEVTANGARIDIASITLAAPAVADGRVTFTGATATLTAAGAAVLGDDYPAGRVMDPLTFSFPAPAASPTPPASATPTPSASPSTAPAALAPASPTVTVDRTTGLNGAGDTVTVTGSGFLPQAPATTGTRPPLAGKFTGAYVIFGKFADVWRPSADAPSSARKVESQAWAVPEESIATIGGAAKGAIPLNPDGTFTATISVSDALAASPGNWGIYTYAGGGPKYAPFETFTPVSFAPSVTVSQVTGLDGDGDTVTVTGKHFLPQAPATNGARPPLAGTFSGTYVVFGKFADVWRPSADAPSSARKGETTFWAVPESSVATIGGATKGAIPLNPDGTFTATVAVSDALAASPGNWGIYTYSGSGTKYAPFETYTPVSFAPAVTVSKVTELNGAGETITVSGKHFLPHAPETTGTRPPLAGEFTGVYVAFGRYADVWQPSQGAARTTRANADVRWLLEADNLAAVGGSAAGAVPINADGSFSITLAASKGFTGDPGAGTYGVVTYPGGGATYVPFETITPVSFVGDAPAPEAPPAEVPPTTAPQPPAAPQPTTVGRLTWGVDADFRAYVTGPIAQGAISVTGASSSGSSFTFVQSGGSANPSAGSGSANYAGAVTFTGHAGALTLRLSDPTVRLTSTTSAVLSLAVNGSRVDFATLDLGAATLTTSGDAVRYSGAPATLTAAGSVAFNDFYPAGRALDPVTVTFGVGTTATGSGTKVVAAAAPPAAPDAIPDAAPATTGVELDAATLADLIAGNVVTVKVAGFLPNETGIRVVLYSTPTVLAEGLTADAQGVVTWTGSLPQGLTGAHTLTFQGSVDKGIAIEVPVAIPGSCLIEEATLTWGMKEAFRAYVESTIAKGGWELSGDVADVDGGYLWSAGSGSIEPDGSEGTLTFGGAVRFTGHEGVLDTTVSNPVIELSGDTGVLYLGVSGDTQSGTSVDLTGVRFATLDLAAGVVSEAAGVVTIADIPATLTADGAAAFGTYPEGEALDPVTITLASDSDCALGLTGAAPVEPSPSAEPTADVTSADSGAASTDDGTPWWVWAAIAGALAAAVAAVLVWRSRR